MGKKKKAQHAKKTAARPRRKSPPKSPREYDFTIEVSFHCNHTFSEDEMEDADEDRPETPDVNGCHNLGEALRQCLEGDYQVGEINVDDNGDYLRTSIKEIPLDSSKSERKKRSNSKATGRKRVRRVRHFDVSVFVVVTMERTFEASKVKDKNTDSPKLTDDAAHDLEAELEQHLSENGFMVSSLDVDDGSSRFVRKFLERHGIGPSGSK